MDLSAGSLDVSGDTVLEETAFNCECGYSTKDRSNFRRHTMRHINVNHTQTSTPIKSTTNDKNEEHQPSTAASNVLYCEHCGKDFKSKFGLNLHVKNKHELSFKHTCEMCGKGFNQSVQYRFHCSKHLKTSLHRCSACKAEFYSPSSLKRHLKTCAARNENVKQYKCDNCSASFEAKQRLTEHVKGKHKEPRHMCDQCGRCFAWRSCLKAHMKTHTAA